MNTLKTKSNRKMPLALSHLSAGDALEITSDYELLDINEMITKGREGFVAYPVTGDSMVEAIQPGYIVFVDSYAEPHNGSVVACSVNGLNCVKIFQQRTTGLYLVSTNKNYKPREITQKDNFYILGVVKGHLAVY